MNYRVKTISNFNKNLKRLSKKYISLHDDVSQFGDKLSNDPTIGTELFANCYKIPIPISCKNKSKRSGARVITYIFIDKETVYLLTIFDKSEQENISKQELRKLI